MVVRTNIEVERKKARDFLAGDPNITIEDTRPVARASIEKLDVIESQERKKPKVEIKNPRLRTEAYLKRIGKL